MIVSDNAKTSHVISSLSNVCYVICEVTHEINA